LLQELVKTSRRIFGFFTKHYAHTINYPWVVSRLAAVAAGSRVLDGAAGVSPVPVYLAERGLLVDCVDNSDIVRTLPPGEDWNEWGFFDYGTLHPNLAAYNCSIVGFEPSHAYNAIYSISSIGHFPSAVREQRLKNCSAWLTARAASFSRSTSYRSQIHRGGCNGRLVGFSFRIRTSAARPKPAARPGRELAQSTSKEARATPWPV
jgi:hypothetical protein